MNTNRIESIEASWTRLGVLLPVTPAKRSPDLERLLLESARQLSGNARLFPVVASWLAEYGGFVAKHRLGRLITAELEAQYQAALGLLIETAVLLGAPSDLSLAAQACRAAPEPAPLFSSHQRNPQLASLAQRTASPLSRKWGAWSPDIERKRDAIRPVTWLLTQNPEFRERIIRKGDLRCSILESLRLDTNGMVRSEADLARLSGATRAAVRKSVAALIKEGEVRIVETPADARSHGIALSPAA